MVSTERSSSLCFDFFEPDADFFFPSLDLSSVDAAGGVVVAVVVVGVVVVVAAGAVVVVDGAAVAAGCAAAPAAGAAAAPAGVPCANAPLVVMPTAKVIAMQ